MKKLISLTAALLMLLLTLSAALADSLPMVVDNAGLFTEDQISEMESLITDIRNTYQMDAVVLTTKLSRMDDDDLQDYADDYYDEHGYGLGDDLSGALIMIDMGNRYVHISTSGSLIPYLNDDRKDEILDEGTSWMRSGNYGAGVVAMLKQLRSIIRGGVEEGSFLYDSQTGKRLSGVFNRLTSGELMFSLFCGAVTALILILVVISRYSLKKSTYRFDKMTQTAMNLNINQEQFLRQTVRRVPRMSSRGPGGGHGGPGGGRPGGGRGASVHVSHGGSFHGGGGRHF